jgi:hypothetical protein
MRLTARRALIPLVLLALAGCDSSPAKYYFKYKPPPDDEPVDPGLTPDNTIHCNNPTNYRDLTNPCTRPADAIEVRSAPPLQLTDGGLPELQSPPSPWPEIDSEPVDVCPDIPVEGGSFESLRLEMPCVDPADMGLTCKTLSESTTSVQIAGKANKTYRINIRVRGVVELRHYQSGVALALPSRLYVGGSFSQNTWGVWKLSTSSGSTHYFLNEGKQYVSAIDYEATIEAVGGEELTLWANSLDGNQLRNVSPTTNQPIVVDDIPPAPAPFAGGFVQIDFLDAEEVP